ncbi:MAG TPA: hypothetical protein VG934_01955 [Candidatus Paceibacterota bacterium]|nr:hypothetical protein [Candidatus Paceibacterota bacterium]
MIRGTLLILLALFIDLVQAGISMAIFAIASAPGTALGGAGGAIAGAKLCGVAGSFLSGLCATAGGFVFGLLGSTLNPILLPFTEPVGAAAGFAIDICLSATLGSFLIVMVYIFVGKVPVSRLFFGLGEIIPGINNLPFWTAFVIFCLIKKEAQEGKGALGVAARITLAGTSPGNLLGAAAAGIQAINNGSGRAQPPVPQFSQRPKEEAFPSARGMIPLARTMNADIRPSTPHTTNDNIPPAANDNLLRGIQAHAT